MKTKKYYLILAIVIGILCVPALAKRPNPTLAGIGEFYVFIVSPDGEPNKDGLVFEELQRKVEHKLEEAGIKYVKPRSFPTPELRIYIDMLKLDDSQQYVFHIQTSLARKVALPQQRKLGLKADVWKTEPKMQVVSVKDMPAGVTNVVLEQVDTFITAYKAANPKGVQPTDANDIAVIKNEPPTRAVKSTPAEYKYVASKNSKVFHRPQCSSAKRIKPENLVDYSSRDEAIKAGKRPCKLCKP